MLSRWLLAMAFLHLRLWFGENRLDVDYDERFALQGVPPANELREALGDALRNLSLPCLMAIAMQTASWLPGSTPAPTPTGLQSRSRLTRQQDAPLVHARGAEMMAAVFRSGEPGTLAYIVRVYTIEPAP